MTPFKLSNKPVVHPPHPPVVFTHEQHAAVVYSIKSSIELYAGYVKLTPETPAMKRKQTVTRKRLIALLSALKRL